MSRESERLFDAITQIDDELLPSEIRPKRRLPSWRAFAAAAAILAIILSPFVIHIGSRTTVEEAANGTEPFALAQPVYPVMAAYPTDGNGNYEAWRADVQKQTDQPEGYAASLKPFLRESLQTFLTGAGTENRAYSPANVYMALAMLAETTDGESRTQILNLLGAESIESLRAQAGSVWNANYRDDGATKSVLASSLWLRDGGDYRQQTVDSLAQYYYASVFRGEMGSEAYDQALQRWLNEQTGDLLTEQAAQEHLDADTLLALATTIDFRASWWGNFSEEATAPGIFHGAQGDETVDMMHQSDMLSCHYGAGYAAVGLILQSGGTMWFLLPDEGSSPEALLENEEALTFFMERPKNLLEETPLVHLTLPKFDVSSRISLLDGLRSLGVTDVCDAARADFSPLGGEMEDAYLSDATHAARVTIDEEGVTAAAYTLMAVGEGAADPSSAVTFTIDRPFLFVITGDQGLPLFAGIVNQI